MFRKPLHEAAWPLSTSQSVVSGAMSSQLELAAACTPDWHCQSSCCWTSPRFEVGSTPSCSATPCSTRCQNTPTTVDDVMTATSPCSSSTSSSSSSSSTGSSCDRQQQTGVGCGGNSSSLSAADTSTAATVRNEPCRETVVVTESANPADDVTCVSMHPAAAQCTLDTQLLLSQKPAD